VLDDVATQYQLGADGSPLTPSAQLQGWGNGVHQATALHQILDGSPLQVCRT